MAETEKEKIREQIIRFINHMIVLNKFPVWHSRGKTLQTLENYSVHILEHAGCKVERKKEKGKKKLNDASYFLSTLIDNTNRLVA